MDIEKLKNLEQNAIELSGWTSTLIEFETNPNILIPNYFDTAEDYRLHIECMIGSCRILLGVAYNAIDEWQDV